MSRLRLFAKRSPLAPTPKWQREVASIARIVLPVNAIAFGATGAGLTYNWEKLASEHSGLGTLYRFIGDNIGTAFVWLFASYILIYVLDLFISPSLKKLQAKLDLVGASVRSLFDGLMTDLSMKLSVKPGDRTRVSIYVHDRDGSFVLSGRFAPDPVLRKPGRTSYPDNQGCIAAGWRDGWHFENDLGAGVAYENQTVQRYGMSLGEVRNLTMKSRLFGVKRLDCNNEFIAVVVVESMQADRFDQATLRVDLDRFESDYSAMIASLLNYVALPSEARERGFG